MGHIMGKDNLVFAKHDNCSQEFLFSVPWYLEVRKGDVLLVDTIHGEAVATATSELFEGRDIDEVAVRFGAYLPLKRVKAVAGKKIREYIRVQIYDEIKHKVGKAFLEVRVNV